MNGARQSPKPGDCVSIEGRVRADNGNSFDHCLSDDQTVKWIGMLEWQRTQDSQVVDDVAVLVVKWTGLTDTGETGATAPS